MRVRLRADIPTTDGQSAFVVKYSTDGGLTWNVLEKMGIAQNVGTAYKNTWDFLVAQGYGKPETRRLPYDDYGLFTIAGHHGQRHRSRPSRRLPTTPRPAGLEVGRLRLPRFRRCGNEECVEVPGGRCGEPDLRRHRDQEPSGRRSTDPALRSGRPPILLEGNDLAFDIKAVASPNPGSDLTVVIQT